MRTYRMTLAYDGTAYCGWQIQPGAPSIQETLEAALQRIVGQPVRVVASGRTDAGVHAQGQVASFRCATRLPTETLRRALNANTAEDIHVRRIQEAPPGFHAIRDALSKRYRYLVQDAGCRNVFLRTYCWCVPQALDEGTMGQAARYLLGRHDFRSFEAAGGPRKTSVRTILDVSVQRREQDGMQSIAIEVEADGFLYNMVRIIVGSLVCVGRGRQSVPWMRSVLQARERSLAGPTAPACGLTLLEVRYAW